MLQKIEKLDAEAVDITASVRDLPTVRTAVGRARAWLRLALMQVRGNIDEYLIQRGDKYTLTCVPYTNLTIIALDRPFSCFTFIPDSFSNRESIFQKKLADYFRLLVSQGEMLAEFYETAALMRSDEANLISALLTSLNVVDCNLCVKVRENNQTEREENTWKFIF